jgi:hypothetical protein
MIRRKRGIVTALLCCSLAVAPAAAAETSWVLWQNLTERCDGRFGYVFVRSNSHAAKQRTWT